MLLPTLMIAGIAILAVTIIAFGQLHQDDKALYIEGLSDDMSR